MAKTPKIRFKNFSDEWVERKADEICTIETGKSNTQDQNDNGKYPFYIRSDKPVRSNKFLYDCEAVITIGDGSIGKVFHYVKGKFDLHQRCYKMTDFKDVTGKYFYYYFSTKFYDRAMKMTAKATVDSVRLEMISDMFFSIPNNLAEQCKISEFFTKLDKLITLHQSKFEKLQKIKKSCLQNLFPQNNQNTPKIRFKNFTDEWVENVLNKMAYFSKGYGYSKSDLVDRGSPIILYGRLYTNYQTTIKNVDTFVKPKKNSVFSVGGEVIIPSSGETAEDIARASSVAKAGIILGGDLNIIFVNKKINSEFLALSISNGKQQKELSKKAQGKSIVHLQISDLSKLNIIYPNLAEQCKISEFFTKLDKLILLHQSKFEKLQKIKKSCLQNMFV